MGDHAWVRIPVLGVEGLDVTLLEVGVQLDLVDRGHDLDAVEQSREVLDGEVADAMARTLPSLSRCSSARYNPSV
jgi:hypothetical protein